MQACRCIVSEPGQGGSCRHIDFVQPACMHVDVLPCWAVAALRALIMMPCRAQTCLHLMLLAWCSMRLDMQVRHSLPAQLNNMAAWHGATAAGELWATDIHAVQRQQVSASLGYIGPSLSNCST